MNRILIAAAIAIAAALLTTTANTQAVVSSDCKISRVIEAYAWQALDDAERLPASNELVNGLRVYLRTVQQQTKKVCR